MAQKWKDKVHTLELNVTLIFSIISTKISSRFLPPGSFATTDLVTAVPGIRFEPCCEERQVSTSLHCNFRLRIKSYGIDALSTFAIKKGCQQESENFRRKGQLTKCLSISLKYFIVFRNQFLFCKGAQRDSCIKTRLFLY
jgi:hypothetical protein